MQNHAAPTRIRQVAAISSSFFHFIGNPHYGFFRDELYFIVCGRHPQWNYVDQPPVAPLVAAASQVLGPSLALLKAVPAFFAAAGVYTTCALAVELGGECYAEIISAIIVFFLPVLTDFGMKVSPDPHCSEQSLHFREGTREHRSPLFSPCPRCSLR